MNKKSVIVGLVLLICIVLFSIFFNFLQSRDIRTSKDMLSISTGDKPEIVVRQYYESHIKRLNNGLATQDDTLNQKYVTEKFISDIKGSQAKFPEGISYDPFICAQDYPDNSNELVINLLEKSDSNASLEVKVLDNWKPMMVSMVRGNSGWRIDRIVCSQ